MFEYSGATFNDISTLETALATGLSEDIKISVREGFDDKADTSKWKEDVLPVVVLVSGAGGNGKDTFIDCVNKHLAVENISSIDEIKNMAASLITLTADNRFETVNGVKEMTDKTDRYREFLHELKMAWSKFNSGPNNYMLQQINHILTMHEDEREKFDVIFVHVREADEIIALKSNIERFLGIGCVTLCITGRVDPSEYQNECDKNIDEYKFDVTINNAGDLMILELQAMIFASRLQNINMTYGIECQAHKHTTTEETPKVATMADVTNDKIHEVISSVVNQANEVASEEVPTIAGFHTNLDVADLT